MAAEQQDATIIRAHCSSTSRSRPAWRQVAWLVSLLGVCWLGAADAAVRVMAGYATDPETGELVYTEQHRIVEKQGKPVSHKVRYFLPDGTEFARKKLNYQRDAYAPRFEFSDDRAGYSEAGGPTDLGYVIQHQMKGEEPESKVLEPVTFLVADTGFNAYMRDHMALILKGNVLRFYLAVPGRMNQYEFQVKVKRYLTSLGRRSVELEVAPTSVLLRTLADPLLLHYDMETRELLVWQGSTNIINPATGKRNRLRVEFPLDQNRLAGAASELDDPGAALEELELDAGEQSDADEASNDGPDDEPEDAEQATADAPEDQGAADQVDGAEQPAESPDR